MKLSDPIAPIVIKALNNPHRRNILKYCSYKECNQKWLAQELSLSQSSVSNHLSVLTEADLLSVRLDYFIGGLRHYRTIEQFIKFDLI